VNTKRQPAFVGAPVPSLAADLLGELVAFEPGDEETIETTIGPSEAVMARVVVIHDDGTFSDLGENPVFWTIVRRQLLTGKEEAPWVVGRVVKPGQALRLQPPTDAEQSAIAKVLAKVQAA
jgi:hypothetical protein